MILLTDKPRITRQLQRNNQKRSGSGCWPLKQGWQVFIYRKSFLPQSSGHPTIDDWAIFCDYQA